MVGRFLLRLAGRIVARPIRRSIAEFHQATLEPERIQLSLLKSILSHQAETSYGKDHHFSSIHTVEDFRRHVPINPYETLAPYIDRVKAGEANALLASGPPLMFALTSGSTAARKHIPITKDYLNDYRRGWNIWGLTAFQKHKKAQLKPVMQLVGDPEEYRTQSGIPCGNLSGFTVMVQKRIVRFLYSVPTISGKIKESPLRYYVALRFSIPRSVGLLSSANPSTLIALARVMDLQKENLIRDIRDGTLNRSLELAPEVRAKCEQSRRLRPNPECAARLEELVKQHGSLLPKDVWSPDKLLIGCWTGGSVGPYLRQMSQYYGSTPIRDIGLLASEGRMTIPIEDMNPSGILDITSHYFEFVPEGEIDSNNPIVLGAHELEIGKSYYILPTTKSGLYRYHICDLVRVTGFANRTPMVEFLGKGNRFANLTGEKLSEYQVCQAVDIVAKSIPQPITAYSLAPCWDDKQPYYAIFLEEQDLKDEELTTRFSRALDQQLKIENSEYEAKRESERLGAIKIVMIPSGTWQRWDRDRVQKTGGSPEQYKHPCLIGDIQFQNQIPVIRMIL